MSSHSHYIASDDLQNIVHHLDNCNNFFDEFQWAMGFCVLIGLQRFRIKTHKCQ